MLNSTCKMLSAGCKFVAQDTSLVVKPCCYWRGDVEKIETKQDIVQWRRSLHSLNSYAESSCYDCNYLDRSRLKTSRRQLSFQHISNSAEIGDPAWLEIQTDLTCNGGCITCGPELSSYWAQELGVPIKTSQRQDGLQKISELVDLAKAQHIVILGGEPLLSNTDERLLDYIDDPSKVSLQITTNGSVYPSAKKFAAWKRFKSVLINFSIDGIQARFEYLRYPLKWSKVQQNMRTLNEEASDNVRFKINHTITSLNLFYYDEFISWYGHLWMNNPRNRGWNLTTGPAIGIMSPQIVSESLAAMVRSKYGAEPPATAIEQTVLGRADVRKYLEEIDQRRNLDWQQIFPEIAKAL